MTAHVAACAVQGGPLLPVGSGGDLHSHEAREPERRDLNVVPDLHSMKGRDRFPAAIPVLAAIPKEIAEASVALTMIAQMFFTR